MPHCKSDIWTDMTHKKGLSHYNYSAKTLGPKSTIAVTGYGVHFGVIQSLCSCAEAAYVQKIRGTDAAGRKSTSDRRPT